VVHPEAIWKLTDATDVNSARRELQEEQHDEPLQSAVCPHLNCDEVGGYDQFPMPLKKFSPSDLSLAFRREFNSVLFSGYWRLFGAPR